MMKLYTKSRDGVLYNATAIFEDGIVTVCKGSKKNRKNAVMGGAEQKIDRTGRQYGKKYRKSAAYSS